MSFSRAKIEAQNILLTTRKKALAVCFLGVSLRLICMLCTAVSLYSLLHLAEYPLARQSLYIQIGLYALFAVSTLLSLWLFALLVFLQKRWFLENATHKMRIAQFFCRMRFAQAIKIGAVYYFKKALSLFEFLFYLLPFFIIGAGLIYELQNTGLSSFLAVFSLAFLGVLFFVGLYFGFAAVQKYAFFDAILAKTPHTSFTQARKTSRDLARQNAFPAVQFKLRFTLWVLCSFLILPAFYALPYYRQSVACMEKFILVKNHLLQDEQKPIVFFVQTRKPLQA